MFLTRSRLSFFSLFLYIRSFSLLLKFSSFSLVFSSLIITWLGVILNMFLLLGNFSASWICKFTVFIRFGKCSLNHHFYKDFLTSLPSEIPITYMLSHPMLSHSSLRLFSQSLLFIYLFIYCFLGLPLRHMEVPRLGVESELQLLVYATATATWDPSCVCNLYHTTRQRRIPNHLARPGIETAASWISVRFVSIAPQRELPRHFSCYASIYMVSLLWFQIH